MAVPSGAVRAEGWFSIGSIGLTAITSFAEFALQTIFGIVGNLIGILARMLDVSTKVRAGGDVPIVAASWKILRDFSNMLFIILLIYMSFATIFDQGNYKFSSMIGRFLIVAILINFSLAIGNIVIDATQVLANIFLGAIGNLGDRLGQYLTLTALMPSKVNAGDLLFASLASMTFAVVMQMIFLFSLLVANAFAIIRIPFIWFLLIVSPLAWMSHILPNSNTWWKKWWSSFVGWNLFLPVYLFFMYLGLLFLSKRDEVLFSVVQVNPSGSSSPLNTPLLWGATNTVTFNLIFFYILTAVIMVGGTWAAKSVTSMMSGGKAFERGLGLAKSLIKRTPLPYVGSLEANQYAAQQRLGQFQQKGFQNKYLNKLYGGKEGLERAKSEAAARWRVGGAAGVQKDFVAQVKKVSDDIEEKYDTGQLSIKQLTDKVAATKAHTAEGYAYRKLAIKKGALSDADFRSSLGALKNNPYAVQDLTKTAKDAKFSGMDNVRSVALDASLNTPGLVAAKREMLMHISEDSKQAGKFNAADLTAAFTVLGGEKSPESKKFVKNLSKFRPDITIPYQFNYDTLNPTGTPIKTISQRWDGALNTDVKDVVSMPMAVWNEPEFRRAMLRKIGPFNDPVSGPRSRAQTKLRDRYVTLLMTAPDGQDKWALLPTP